MQHLVKPPPNYPTTKNTKALSRAPADARHGAGNSEMSRPMVIRRINPLFQPFLIHSGRDYAQRAFVAASAYAPLKLPRIGFSQRTFVADERRWAGNPLFSRYESIPRGLLYPGQSLNEGFCIAHRGLLYSESDFHRGLL